MCNERRYAQNWLRIQWPIKYFRGFNLTESHSQGRYLLYTWCIMRFPLLKISHFFFRNFSIRDKLKCVWCQFDIVFLINNALRLFYFVTHVFSFLCWLSLFDLKFIFICTHSNNELSMKSIWEVIVFWVDSSSFVLITLALLSLWYHAILSVLYPPILEMNLHNLICGLFYLYVVCLLVRLDCRSH